MQTFHEIIESYSIVGISLKITFRTNESQLIRIKNSKYK